MNRLLTPALSLAVLAVTAGCMSPPKDLDLALTRPTVDNKYVVTLQPPRQAGGHQPVARVAGEARVACRRAGGERPHQGRRRHAAARPRPAHAAAGDARTARRRLPDRGHEVQHDRLVGDQARHRRPRRRRPRHLQHRRRRSRREPLKPPQRHHEETTMRRLDSMVWMLGSAAAAVCAALTVTLAERRHARAGGGCGALERRRAGRAGLAQPEAAAAGAGRSVQRGRTAARRRRAGPAPLQRRPPQPQRRRLVRQLPRSGQAVPGRPAGEPGRGHRLAPRHAHRRRRPQPLAVLGRPQGQPVGAGARPARGCRGAWDQPHAGGTPGGHKPSP